MWLDRGHVGAYSVNANHAVPKCLNDGDNRRRPPQWEIHQRRLPTLSGTSGQQNPSVAQLSPIVADRTLLDWRNGTAFAFS